MWGKEEHTEMWMVFHVLRLFTNGKVNWKDRGGGHKDRQRWQIQYTSIVCSYETTACDIIVQLLCTTHKSIKLASSRPVSVLYHLAQTCCQNLSQNWQWVFVTVYSMLTCTLPSETLRRNNEADLVLLQCMQCVPVSSMCFTIPGLWVDTRIPCGDSRLE